MSKTLKPQFFATPDELRKWFEQNHQKAPELLLGYYKKATKKPSVTWPESVDQAICYGWIDGIRRSLGAESYTIRFTPRRPNSIWSAVNINKYKALTKAGLLKPAGIAAYKKHKEKKSKVYAYEQKVIKLDQQYEDKIKADKKAWTFFDALAPSYKKASIWHVMSAKKEETRQRRLNLLIESSKEGLKLPHLRRK